MNIIISNSIKGGKVLFVRLQEYPSFIGKIQEYTLLYLSQKWKRGTLKWQNNVESPVYYLPGSNYFGYKTHTYLMSWHNRKKKNKVIWDLQKLALYSEFLRSNWTKVIFPFLVSNKGVVKLLSQNLCKRYYKARLNFTFSHEQAICVHGLVYFILGFFYAVLFHFHY